MTNKIMNKSNLLVIFIAIVLIFAVGNISAKTLITGKIYNADFSDVIINANVTVNCIHNGSANILNTLSIADGVYSVIYTENVSTGCNNGDELTVSAIKDGLYGSRTGIINKDAFDTWDLAVVNVPLVPEFSTIIGIMTILGALGVFFVIKRD